MLCHVKDTVLLRLIISSTKCVPSALSDQLHSFTKTSKYTRKVLSDIV